MSPKAYERDAYQRDLQTVVTSHGKDGDRPYVVLEDTVLYPEGGGQPADRGTIAGIQVVDVQKVEGDIRHYLESELHGGSAEVLLDWDRRFDHMQQHSAQHLLSALAEDRFSWKTTAFHLGSELSDIELELEDPDPAKIHELEECAAQAIRNANPIAARYVSVHEYESLSVRSRGLPKGHVGDVRLVSIEGIDLNTCGGTHVSSTAQLEAVKLLRYEPIRSGIRLSYVAGRRLRRWMHDHEERAYRLRRLLGVGDESILESVETRIQQLKEASRREKRLESHWAQWVTAALNASPKVVLSEHFEDASPGFLQQIARSMEPHRVILLSTGDASGGFFVLAVGADTGLEAPPLGREVASLLGGQGGGKGVVFQGKVPSLQESAIRRAIEFLRERVEGTPS